MLSTVVVSLGATELTAQRTAARGGEPSVWRNPRMVEELRIGVLEGDDNYIFGSVGNVAVANDGTMYVLDSPGPRLRMYDAKGKFVRQVGRAGAGPGEHRGIVGMAFTKQGELAVWDVELDRVTIYSGKGDFVRSFTHQGNYFGGDDFRVDTAGNFWIYNARTIPGPREASAGYYARVSPAGAILDTLWIPRPTLPEQKGGFVVMTPEGYMQPFPTEFSLGLSPLGYLVTGVTDKYVLEIVRRGQPPAALIRRDVEPVRLKPEEKAEWEARAQFYDRRGGASAGTEIKSVKPPWRELAIGDDGRIWVDRYTEAKKRPITAPRPATAPPALTWRDVRTFDVFEPDGRFLGTVVPPENSRLLVRRGNHAWGIRRGELDEQYLVRFRIEAGR
jgi:hypothetical protein